MIGAVLEAASKPFAEKALLFVLACLLLALSLCVITTVFVVVDVWPFRHLRLALQLKTLEGERQYDCAAEGCKSVVSCIRQNHSLAQIHFSPLNSFSELLDYALGMF